MDPSSPPTPLFERVLATQGDPDDTEVYLAYFRFPDRETMDRCLAPLGLAAKPSLEMARSALLPRRHGMQLHVRGLELVLRLKPASGDDRLAPEDAEAARELERAFAGLELVKFRLPFPANHDL